MAAAFHPETEWPPERWGRWIGAVSGQRVAKPKPPPLPPLPLAEALVAARQRRRTPGHEKAFRKRVAKRRAKKGYR